MAAYGFPASAPLPLSSPLHFPTPPAPESRAHAVPARGRGSQARELLSTASLVSQQQSGSVLYCKGLTRPGEESKLFGGLRDHNGKGRGHSLGDFVDETDDVGK